MVSGAAPFNVTGLFLAESMSTSDYKFMVRKKCMGHFGYHVCSVLLVPCVPTHVEGCLATGLCIFLQAPLSALFHPYYTVSSLFVLFTIRNCVLLVIAPP